MASESELSPDPFNRPTVIETLSEHVDSVHEYGHFERGDDKTISVVVRDEDGEILGETGVQATVIDLDGQGGAADGE
jgi:hypothetical protein